MIVVYYIHFKDTCLDKLNEELKDDESPVHHTKLSDEYFINHGTRKTLKEFEDSLNYDVFDTEHHWIRFIDETDIKK